MERSSIERKEEFARHSASARHHGQLGALWAALILMVLTIYGVMLSPAQCKIEMGTTRPALKKLYLPVEGLYSYCHYFIFTIASLISQCKSFGRCFRQIKAVLGCP